jgi:RHS repeat-associated protein
LELIETDLTYSGLGIQWGQTRSYSNIYNLGFNGPTGINWFVEQIPYLQPVGGLIPGTIYVVGLATARKAYIRDGLTNNYLPMFYQQDTLTYDPAANQYILTNAQTGSQQWFYAFDAGSKAGKLRALIDPAGDIVPASYDSQGRMVSIARVYNNQQTGFYYTYVDSTSAQLAAVTLQLNGVDQRRVAYTYYGSGDPNGLPSDLQSATVQQWNTSTSTWDTIRTSYYRYYITDNAYGFQHGLKYVLTGASYDNMVADGFTPSTSTDAQLSEYADNYFEYDSSNRVTLEVTNGDAYSSAFVYYNNGIGTPDFNQWVTKTTETLTDGSQNIVYCNTYGQWLFKIYQSGGSKWYQWTQYDNNGRTLQEANSSAIANYSESNPSLAILNTNSGLITLTSYYAGGNPYNQPIGYKESESVQQGSAGTPVLLKKWTYIGQTLGNQTVYQTATETIYQSSTGTLSPAQTRYSYLWYSGTFRIQQQTTIWPTITTNQNGSGTSNSQTVVYDLFGNKTWLRNERGFLTNYTSDPISGGLTQQIQDVNTSILPAPNGWTTPAGGGLHLITDYTVDVFGRQTQSLGPVHTIDLNGTATSIRRAQWTIYQDAQHEIWTGNGYATGSSPSYIYTLINPVNIEQRDASDREIGEIQATRASSSGQLLPTDSFPQNSWTKWNATNYDLNGRLTWLRTYFLIPSSGSGTVGTNFEETDFAYDSMGRAIKNVTPAGTIARSVLNPKGWVVSGWVGTNDNGATPSDPTGDGAPGNNMVQITGNVYDGGSAGGDGILTQQTLFASASDTRMTSFGYDFRNRKIWADGEIDFYQTYTYDNLDRLIQTDNYNTSASGHLVSRSATAYDNLGRIYQKQQYAVDPATGTIGNVLTQNLWYDATGNVILNQPLKGRGFVKSSYDSLNRQVGSYQACNSTPQTYSTAGTVNADTVLEQTIITYDAASNLIFQVASQRDHNASGIGVLNGPNGSQPQARVSYTSSYPDPLGRIITQANYGTNAGYAVTPSAVAPAPSDTILVSYTNYDNAGNLVGGTDAQGMVTQLGYDNAGRVTQKVENYQGSGSGPAINKTTLLTYYAGKKLATLTLNNSITGNQTTRWVYGSTLADSGVASGDLLSAKIYPDSTSGSDQILYGYNRLGQLSEQTDQNGTVREFNYDKLGRLSDDMATTLGAGVDNTIQRISRTYEVRGMLQNITSYDDPVPGSGNVVNEAQMVYDDFQQILIDFQSHDGAVDPESTPTVDYTYADGSNNTIRLTGLTYPNGRVLNYGYGATNSIDDLFDRVANIDDGATPIVAYTKLGIDRTVLVQYPEPSIAMTYIKLAGEANGDGGDQYTGLDRFNRIDDIRWINNSNADINRYKYGFDRAGNRLWRQNVIVSGLDEQYVYDGLYQVSQRLVGTLAAGSIIGVPSEEENFTYDPSGNWPGYVVRNNGSVTLNQGRTHQLANQISSISSSSSTVGYDADGNMTTMPQVDNWGTAQTLAYDAWNRLVTVKQDTKILGTYQYDGLNRRIWKQTLENCSPVIQDFYYSKLWQVLEERIDNNATANNQYVWGTRYEDDLVLRDNFGAFSGRLYALADYFQPTAIADAAGVVQERYVYSAFGSVLYYDGQYDPISSSNYDWTYLYGSYQLDLETNLYQVRNRYYHTALGRWLTRDSLTNAEVSEGPNLYWYVQNNAINFIDATGLCCEAEQAKYNSALSALQNAQTLLSSKSDKLMSAILQRNRDQDNLQDALSGRGSTAGGTLGACLALFSCVGAATVVLGIVCAGAVVACGSSVAGANSLGNTIKRLQQVVNQDELLVQRATEEYMQAQDQVDQAQAAVSQADADLYYCQLKNADTKPGCPCK